MFPRSRSRRGHGDSLLHITKRFTYFIGSDNGCGCGFRQEHDYTIDDPEVIDSKRDNQKRLYDYIGRLLTMAQPIEPYSWWSGDEALPVEHERTIALKDLLDESFCFAERQRTTVLQDANRGIPHRKRRRTTRRNGAATSVTTHPLHCSCKGGPLFRRFPDGPPPAYL